ASGPPHHRGSAPADPTYQREHIVTCHDSHHTAASRSHLTNLSSIDEADPSLVVVVVVVVVVVEHPNPILQ
ncbi:hypothetical protein, partial [Arenibacter latericius]|uniref:hypothetical protein n=1 Tax=Arenibacter latericius TaxID=86104 RepID=UPI00047B8650